MKLAARRRSRAQYFLRNVARCPRAVARDNPHEFLLLRPTFVSPYFWPEGRKTAAQVSARPDVPARSAQTGRRTIRPRAEHGVVGGAKRGGRTARWLGRDLARA